MENKNTHISVVMCTYNGARYIKEQLDSILTQTLPPDEIIIQDDGSTDQTRNIIEAYTLKDYRIKFYRNTGIHGINSNFFSAIRRAKGTYIALCDQDDIWEPDKLELQAKALGTKLLCSGRSIPFSDDGYPTSHDMRPCNYDILRIAYIGVLPGHTFMLNRKLLEFIPHGEDCPYLYDWQLQLIAAAAESIVYINHPLVNFRRHHDAATATLPINNKVFSIGGLSYICTSILYHTKLQDIVCERFKYILKTLDTLPFQQTSSWKKCHEMALLQTERGPIGFLKRMFFFIHHRRHLFYTQEGNNALSLLKAAIYPFTCGYYYRGALKHSNQ